MQRSDQRGIAIIIVIVILGAIVAIGLGISTIVVRELRISSLLDDSAAAIMAADAGMERALWEVRVNRANPATQYPPVELSNGATYVICPEIGGQDGCRNNNPTRIISEGTFGDTTRSLKVEF